MKHALKERFKRRKARGGGKKKKKEMEVRGGGVGEGKRVNVVQCTFSDVLDIPEADCCEPAVLDNTRCKKHLNTHTNVFTRKILAREKVYSE